jgi:hypothetical protein
VRELVRFDNYYIVKRGRPETPRCP